MNEKLFEILTTVNYFLFRNLTEKYKHLSSNLWNFKQLIDCILIATVFTFANINKSNIIPCA